MTAPELLFYILIAIFAQVAVVGAMAFYRHMRSFKHLEKRLAGFDVPPPKAPGLKTLVPNELRGKSNPWDGFRELQVSRKIFEDKKQDICSFYLTPVDGKPLPAFEPGQFLTFKLDVINPSSGALKSIIRCYSLSDCPGLKYYRVSIKRMPSGMSSNHFHDHVNEGDILSARSPSGNFFLEPGSDPVVLIGGGIGITPMISMLRTTLLSETRREIWLFYGVRNSSDHAMKRRLEDLASKHDNFHMHVCYSAPRPGDILDEDYHHEGHVNVSLLRMTLSFKLYEFFICGPRPMMESLVPALEEWGIPDQHINYESFGPASITRASRPQSQEGTATPETPVTVTFAKTGKTVTWDGSADTLLDLAERNGINIESGCRAGGCGSCQTTIKEGEVTYLQAPDFDPDAGSCLLCISRPKHDLTLEA